MFIFSMPYLKQIGAQANMVKCFALNHGESCWNWSFPICIQVTQMINGIASRRTNISSAPCKPSSCLVGPAVSYFSPDIVPWSEPSRSASWRKFYNPEDSGAISWCSVLQRKSRKCWSSFLPPSPWPSSTAAAQTHRALWQRHTASLTSRDLGLSKKGSFVTPAYVSPENWLQPWQKQCADDAPLLRWMDKQCPFLLFLQPMRHWHYSITIPWLLLRDCEHTGFAPSASVVLRWKLRCT